VISDLSPVEEKEKSFYPSERLCVSEEKEGT
jgi:hypothetical protein